MTIFIFDANFFIGLKKGIPGTLVPAVAEVVRNGGHEAVVLDSVVEEVRGLTDLIRSCYTIVSPPGPKDAMLRELEPFAYGERFFSSEHRRPYFKKERRESGEPDLHMIWFGVLVKRNGVKIGSLDVPRESEVVIVTDDQGIQEFVKDFARVNSIDNFSTMKPISFLPRHIFPFVEGALRNRFRETHGSILKDFIRNKANEERLPELVKAIQELSRGYDTLQIVKSRAAASRAVAEWSQRFVNELVEFLKCKSEALREDPENEPFVPILDALRAFVATLDGWNGKEVPPHEVDETYQRLLLALFQFKARGEGRPDDELARFFFVSLAVDSRVFDASLKLVAYYLQRGDVGRVVECLRLSGGHASALDVDAMVKFQALLGFMLLVRGEREAAEAVARAVRSNLLTGEVEVPPLFQSVSAILRFLGELKGEGHNDELVLRAASGALDAVLGESWEEETRLQFARNLTRHASIIDSFGSPLSVEVLLLATATAIKCGLPGEEVNEAAKRYVRAARTRGTNLHLAGHFKEEILADHTGERLPPDKVAREHVPVAEFAGGFYARNYHVTSKLESEDRVELTCWFEQLSSRVLLRLPRVAVVNEQVRNPRELWLVGGSVRTIQQAAQTRKYGVRAVLELGEDVELVCDNVDVRL
ncbi:MAG: hypothetical protein Kow0069_16150 [Promethearchaeota archaeon]